MCYELAVLNRHGDFKARRGCGIIWLDSCNNKQRISSYPSPSRYDRAARGKTGRIKTPCMLVSVLWACTAGERGCLLQSRQSRQLRHFSAGDRLACSLQRSAAGGSMCLDGSTSLVPCSLSPFFQGALPSKEGLSGHPRRSIGLTKSQEPASRRGNGSKGLL